MSGCLAPLLSIITGRKLHAPISDMRTGATAAKERDGHKAWLQMQRVPRARFSIAAAAPGTHLAVQLFLSN